MSTRKQKQGGDQIEREAMETRRKKQEERGDEDTVKETEKERGDPTSANPFAIL